MLPFAAFSVLFLIVPTALLLVRAFEGPDGSFTLNNIVDLFGNPSIVHSFWLSIEISFVTAVAGALFGFLIAYAIVLGNLPGWVRWSVLTFAGWVLNLGARRLQSADGTRVPLTGAEFELLVAFCEHPNRVLTRDQLLDLTRGRTPSPFDRSVDVQVSRLRRKIGDDPKDPALIQTVRAGGYIFTAQVQAG